jgi:hypothetical protein
MIQPAKTPEKPTVNGLPVSEKPPIEVVKDEAETVENAKPEAIKTQLPEVQTQQSVMKPAEPKSWNKVVSGGQNKQQHPPPHQLVVGQRSKPHVQQQAPPPLAANVQQKKPLAQQRSQPSPKFHYASDQNGQRSKGKERRREGTGFSCSSRKHSGPTTGRSTADGHGQAAPLDIQ